MLCELKDSLSMATADLSPPRQIRIILFGAIVVMVGISAFAWGETRILYVDQSAQGADDGTSWSDAFIDLHDALAIAQAGDEIWVAAGTYKPDRGTGDWTLSFVVPSGVGLYGGFAGWEECLEERDWQNNETILSGDLNDDDTPRGCAEFSDCCREHEGPGCDDPACEALVCSGLPQCCDPGLSEGWGYYCWNSAQRCYYCSRHNCENTYRIVTVTGVDRPTVFDGLTVAGAYASRERNGGTGAGIFCDPCALTIRDCRFRDNTNAGIYAGTGGNITGSNITLLDSSFDHNGRSVDSWQSDVTVTGCTFTENEGSLTVFRGSLTLRDCTFYRDRGLSVHNGNAIIDSCTFVEVPRRALWLDAGQSSISNCRFLRNWSHLSITYSAAVVDNCLFMGSTYDTVGGGGGSALFRNCAFINNAPRGRALSWGYGNLYVLNCTIVGNGVDVFYGAGGIGTNDEYTSAQVLNSIIWGNGGGYNQTREQDQIKVYPGSSFEIDHSIVEGWGGALGGDGNSGVDPMLVDLDGSDNIPGTDDDDARLLPGSPGINAGFPSAYLTPTDLDGHARVLCDRVDIGAYEFGIGDFNCDQTIDLSDFSSWSFCMTGPQATALADEPPVAPGCEAFDFNADGDVDLHDFYMLQQVFVNP